MTGGLSPLFKNVLEIPVTFVKHLVLEGLLEILLRNSLVK
jgi:pantothenate kinase type III